MNEDNHTRLEIDVRIAELRRLYDRIEANVQATPRIMGQIIIALGGTIAALGIDAFIFLAVPPLWGAYMLYAIMIDHDTQKYSALARAIESRLDPVLPDLVFERRLSSRGGQFDDTFLHTFNGIYWGVLNLTSWAIGLSLVWFLRERIGGGGWDIPGWLLLFLAYSVLAVLVLGAAAWSATVGRSQVREKAQLALGGDE